MSHREDLVVQLHDGRPDEPVKLVEAVEILEHRSETMFARPIRLENAIQRRLIPGLIPRGRAQRFVDVEIQSVPKGSVTGPQCRWRRRSGLRNSSIAPSSWVLRSIASAAEIRFISRRQSSRRLA